MPYCAPDYISLKNKTDELQQSFAQLTERYIAPSYQLLKEQLEKLQDLYTQKLKEKEKGRWIKCSPDKARLEQINCIARLAKNMPSEQIAINKDNIERAKSILIGSSLYRYSRINESYDVLFGFFGKAQDNSALNIALQEILGLSKDNKMDSLTWFNCCREYRDYLKKNDNYTSYGYIKNDLNFFFNLEKMITQKNTESLSTVKSLQYILFIQSVAKAVDLYLENVKKLAAQLKKALVSKAKANSSFNKEEILKFLVKIAPENELYNVYSEILPEKYKIIFANSCLKVANEAVEKEFVDDITQRITVYCQYALLAAYILVLTKLDKLQKSDSSDLEQNNQNLVETLKKVLKVVIFDPQNNQLDKENQRLALTSLQFFVNLLDNKLLNIETWGGEETFKRELYLQLVAIELYLSEPATAVACL